MHVAYSFVCVWSKFCSKKLEGGQTFQSLVVMYYRGIVGWEGIPAGLEVSALVF